MSAPTKPGMYFATSREGMRWWDVIVVIGGEAPWLVINDAWQRTSGEKIGAPHQVYMWGPEIEVPEVPNFGRLAKREGGA